MKKPYRIGSVIMVVACSLALMAMSGVGTPVPQDGTAPSFDATVSDTTGTRVEVTSVTIDGNTLFQAFLGKGKVKVPFENISRIAIKDRTACVTLRNAGEMCGLKIGETSKINGSTPYGTYQVSLKDVAWIEISPARK
ncbi:MAG: hypothetical protein WAR22_04975 [Desulfomonilia bacterium]|jgi:hypothetical protein